MRIYGALTAAARRTAGPRATTPAHGRPSDRSVGPTWGRGLDVGHARVADGDVDADGNVIEGLVSIDCGTAMHGISRSGRIVAVAGVDGLVVIDTPDAVLVVPPTTRSLSR